MIALLGDAGVIGGSIIAMLVLSALPALIALIRSSATDQEGKPKRRFWPTFFIWLAIEIAIIVIGLGICLAIIAGSIGGT